MGHSPNAKIGKCGEKGCWCDVTEDVVMPSEWIEEYKTEDGLSYLIPDYKVLRIYSIEAKIKEIESYKKDWQEIAGKANLKHLVNQNVELEAQIKLKQDDWIEACKEIDLLHSMLITNVMHVRIIELEKKLAEAEKKIEIAKSLKDVLVANCNNEIELRESKLQVAVEALENLSHGWDGFHNQPMHFSRVSKEALKKISEGV
jgi:uncharacterized coiled-coil protein SlyX